MTMTRRDLDAKLAKILGSREPIPDEDTLGRPVRCVRCRDTGLIEYQAGEFVTVGVPGIGGTKITATPDRPVYRQCGCRAEKPTPAPRSFSAEGR